MIVAAILSPIPGMDWINLYSSTLATHLFPLLIRTDALDIGKAFEYTYVNGQVVHG